MYATTTLLHLPREVMYMIMDNLSFEERANCRLVNTFLMKVASYIFREVKFTSRSQVKFFAECLIKTPCIGSHVQIIYVNNAALLRAINQTNIKSACHNVKEIQILLTQGRGTWAQHLLPYPRLQHPPALMDNVNAKIILEKYNHQLMTLRLGGQYLNSLSLKDIANLIKTTPQIRTFGLHYLFKEKNKDIHRDLPNTMTFENFNTLLKQPGLMTRFELQYCEIADSSLIAANTTDEDLLRRLRAFRTSPVLYESSLLDKNNTLTHIEMTYVQVTNVTHFVRSILDSFINLESLDINFVGRNPVLEFCVGSQWDLPAPGTWTKDLSHVPSKLRKLALSQTQSRLTISELLTALSNADAPLQDISIVESGDRENASMDIICEHFANTVQRLTMNCKSNFGLSSIGSLVHLKSASLHWAHNHFEMPICPAEILSNSPNLAELELGYNRWYSGMITRPINFDYEPYANITRITLDRIVINENEMKEFMLPLINLKEAIFRRCMFESSKPGNEDEEDYWPNDLEDEEPTALDKEEVFNFMPSTGDLMDKVRQSLFKTADEDEDEKMVSKEDLKNTHDEIQDVHNTLAAVLDDVARSMTEIGSRHVLEVPISPVAPVSTVESPFDYDLIPVETENIGPAENTHLPNGHIDHLLARALAMIRPNNRSRPVNDPALSKKNNLHIRSLSLEHLGLHDCKFREATGGMANARTIRNFEVIQDRRSGCAKSHDIDRAYHEKKVCNPHVILNKKTVTDKTIGFHYTHEFGGTTGKNDYINSRPTFKIRLFSLEKLSIRPNCLMSIYFTGANGERLKSCNSFVNEQVKTAELNNGDIVSLAPPELSSLEDDQNYAKELMNMYKNTIVNEEVTESVLSSTKQQNHEVEEVSQFLTRAIDHPIEVPTRHFDNPVEVRTMAFGSPMEVQTTAFDSPIEVPTTSFDSPMEDSTTAFDSPFRFPTRDFDNSNEVPRMTVPYVQEHVPVFNSQVFDSDIFKSVVYDTCEYTRNHRQASTSKPGKNRKTMTIRPF